MNLPANETYAIHYKHDDYLNNCFVINGNIIGMGSSYPINAPLARKFKENEQAKLLL